MSLENKTLVVNRNLTLLAKVVQGVIDAHNKAASEEEPGFTCGCMMVCLPLTEALEEIGWRK